MRQILATLVLLLLTPFAHAQSFDPAHFAFELRRALAGDAAGAWRSIPWQTDAQAALAVSQRTGRPLFVFVFITVDACLPGESGTQVCLGGRATRGTSLSDPAVIERLRRGFVCLALDPKRGGFPASLPGLALCRSVYERCADPTKGFSAACVLTPDGAHLMGTSGAGTIPRYRESICYDPAKYARFLDESAVRARGWQLAVGPAERGEVAAAVWRSAVATGTPEGFAAGP